MQQSALAYFLAPSFVLMMAAPSLAAAEQSPPLPDAIVDLRTTEGVNLLQGQWRYTDAHIIDADHRAPAADNSPSGPPNRTHDIAPRAGAKDFDDSAWAPISADSLETRRSDGRLSFAWYRLSITIPETVGSLDTLGATVYFEIVVDDYAEIWVDGRLPQTLGQSGGALIAGWNAPNRVLLTSNAKPGDRFQLAVFAANGPLSDPPPNYIWIRSATLDLCKPEHAHIGQPVAAQIQRFDPVFDSIVPPTAQVEKLAEGFSFTEGPVWVPSAPDNRYAGGGTGGYLLFSDPNKNVIHRWDPATGATSIFRAKSGYTGADIGDYHQPGSNGLALDPQGRLTICEHGNRRVTRLEKNGSLTVLADRFEGKRLNSPNDLVYRSDGALYFTDPPFGLPAVYDDPRKELPCSGVFCLYNGVLSLVSKDLAGPNGLAFSPDEKYLYVDNWDEHNKVIIRYEVAADGALSNATTFVDLTSIPGEICFDGLKVDTLGNVYASAPGGIRVYSPEGKHLGTISPPELPANFAFGGADGQMLYMTARTGLYRVRLDVSGRRP